MKGQLQKEIENILRDMGVENPRAVLDVPTREGFGDYSTNVAMMYAKGLGKKPIEMAEEIKESLIVKKIKHIARIDAVLPGFLNFFFDEHFFAKSVAEAISEKDFGKNKNLNGQKFFVEYTQPNPFKEFHIGHLMNNTVGESVTRIIKASDAEVKTATYHGDVGLHVAKAIWGIKELKNPEFGDYMIGLIHELGLGYQLGSEAYDKDENKKIEIIEINKHIFAKDDEEINKIYEIGRTASLEDFESLYKRLGSYFDFHFYESQSGEVGKELVLQNLGKVFEEGDEGAVIFRGENFEPKTHTRVFLNKDKLPTYEAKELGLAKIKKDEWTYDTSVTITANEQDSFFKVVEVAIGEVFPELKGKLKHLSHGMLKLPTGKMSSRTGNIISAENLIDQVKEKVLEKMDSRISPEQSEGNKSYKAPATIAIAEIVAIGAIKYSILHQAIGGDIIFDFEKSLSFEGDSGPYLQYAVVRANSLLKKAEGVVQMSDEIPSEWETVNLERMIERFPDVVEKAGREYAPHFIATYLIELAGEFNSFYANHKIIDATDPTSSYRLALTKAFANIMTSGLNLLGIKVPEQM